MPREQRNDALTLLNIIDDHEMLNITPDSEEGKACIAKLVTMLTEDGYWTLRGLTQEDALKLVNLAEDFAYTGKRVGSNLKSKPISKR